MTPYNYTNAKAYCGQIGLHWLGDDFVEGAANEAFDLGFTQIQFDAAMRQHLWQVKWLFTPSNYSLFQRILLAAHFLFRLR